MSAQSRPLLGDGGEWILSTIKRNPEGLLLLAAGAVLMLRTGSAKSSRPVEDADRATRGAADEMTSRMEGVATEKAGRVMDKAASYASVVADTAREKIDAAKSYASTAAEYADHASRRVGEHSERMIRQTQGVAQGILQDQPLLILAAGLAAGAALAATFPPTEMEKDTLGPVGNEMSKAAGRFGDQVKQATAKAGEKLKSVAEQRGLHPEGLKEAAEEVADTFKASMAKPVEPTTKGPESGAHINRSD